MTTKKTKLFALGISIFTVLCSGCGKKEAAPIKGSADFGYISVEYRDNGESEIYANDLGVFLKDTIDLPFGMNYCTIYGDQLYYVNAYVDSKTGEVPLENSFYIACETLEEKEDPFQILLPLENACAVLESFIQEDILYCSWQTPDDGIKHATADLLSGSINEFFVPEEREVKAVTADGYYYLKEGDLYFSDYKNKKEKLFFESEDQIQYVYRNGENISILTEQNREISLIIVDNNKKIIRQYSGLGEIDKILDAQNIQFVSAKGDVLYYRLSGEMEEGVNNTFLIQMNLEDETKKLYGGWYTSVLK